MIAFAQNLLHNKVMSDSNRLEKIVKKLEEYGYLSVNELSNLVFASQPTIRRDLIILEQRGQINRYHGGAALAKEYVPSMNVRLGIMKKEKQQIAKNASTLIEDGNIIFIDTSTTAMCLIPFLSKIPNIIAVTNSLPAITLLTNADIKAVSTGGEFNKLAMGFIGHQTEKFFDSVMVDVSFMSAPYINKDGIITDYSEGTTYVRQKVLSTCKKSVFLFDNSKFGKTATFRLASIDEFDYMVADYDFSESFTNRKMNVNESNGIFSARVKNRE